MEPETTQENQQAPEQNTQQEAFVPLDEEKATASTPTGEYKDEGWSWGAMMFNMAFAIAVREYMYLFVYLLFLVPIVNFIAMPAVMIFFGLKGREIAQKSKVFANKDQYLGFMKAMDHAGLISFYISLAFFVLGILAMFGLGSIAFMGMHY